jgi:hypothetical protein
MVNRSRILSIINNIIKYFLIKFLNIKNRIKKFFSSYAIYHSFFFGIILNKLDINLNDLYSSNDNSDYNFFFFIFLLSLISLFCFMSVVGYLTSIILINKYDIEIKFPKLKIFIRYFKKSSLLFFTIDFLFCLISLIIIMILSLIELNKYM